MQRPHGNELRSKFWEIALAFLKLGTTAYGGPAIMGVMQAELQERRKWVSKQHFVEGIALVNMLPGASVTQLGIFLGYSRGGWWGGLLAGLCFILPAFFMLLALTLTYALVGATPWIKSALYGLGPVVFAIFVTAVYRLGTSAASTTPQSLIAAITAVVAFLTPLGTVSILALAGGSGLLLFYSRKVGISVIGAIGALVALAHFGPWSAIQSIPALGTAQDSRAPDLVSIGSFFLMVGSLSFGGGLTLLAFIQEQVVSQYRWLTYREFIDGLALGQLTPGPLLMVVAYVGYKLQGVAGAAVAATMIFLPAFVLMLGILPAFERVRQLVWTRAAMKGIAPSVIGVLTISLLRMAPHVVLDAFTLVIFLCSFVILVARHASSIKTMVLGASIGVLHDQLLRGDI